jgi:hypothetical protein
MKNERRRWSSKLATWLGLLLIGGLLVVGVVGRELTAEESPVSQAAAADDDEESGVRRGTGSEGQREEARAKFDDWRKKYAYQSLAARLSYEKLRTITAPTHLSETSKSLLAVEDGPLKGDFHEDWDKVSGSVRAESLRLLHTESVDDFVQRTGFGVSRMPRVGPDAVEHSSAKKVTMPKYPELSAEEGSVAPRTLPMMPAQVLEKSKIFRSDATLIPGNIWLLPSAEEAELFHEMTRRSFVPPRSFGHVESIDRTAGFVPHGMAYYPHSYSPRDAAQPSKPGVYPETWKIARLELVSLLKHDVPRVYLSEHLPNMKELKAAKTRELNAFETSALEKLAAGEELESRATPNQVLMLGAVRAAKACLQCHDVPHGTLLGAFSYDLRRIPPIEVPKAALTQ